MAAGFRLSFLPFPAASPSVVFFLSHFLQAYTQVALCQSSFRTSIAVSKELPKRTKQKAVLPPTTTTGSTCARKKTTQSNLNIM
jgi:hypothetical protein